MCVCVCCVCVCICVCACVRVYYGLYVYVCVYVHLYGAESACVYVSTFFIVRSPHIAEALFRVSSGSSIESTIFLNVTIILLATHTRQVLFEAHVCRRTSRVMFGRIPREMSPCGMGSHVIGTHLYPPNPCDIGSK